MSYKQAKKTITKYMFTVQTLFMPLYVHIIAIYKHGLIKKNASHEKKMHNKRKCTFSDKSTKRNIRSSQWNAHVTSLSLHFVSISITFNATISFYCLNFPTFSICTSSLLCGLIVVCVPQYTERNFSSWGPNDTENSLFEIHIFCSKSLVRQNLSLWPKFVYHKNSYCVTNVHKILFLSCSSLLRITVRLLVVEYAFCSDFHIILCLVHIAWMGILSMYTALYIQLLYPFHAYTMYNMYT